jgi:hypothetical protein
MFVLVTCDHGWPQVKAITVLVTLELIGVQVGCVVRSLARYLESDGRSPVGAQVIALTSPSSSRYGPATGGGGPVPCSCCRWRSPVCAPGPLHISCVATV